MEKERLYQAIDRRHSFRKFLPEGLKEEERKKLVAFCRDMERPFDCDADLVFFQADCSKELYNNGVNPPDNLAIFSETDLVSISKAGFLGELAMLYAVSLGLTTCWFGHYRLKELGKYFEGIASEERLRESTLGYGYGKGTDLGRRVICCMPVGYPDLEHKRFIDYVAGKNGASRKPLEKLLEPGTDLAAIGTDLVDILWKARLAPSAANSQMWRFGYWEGVLSVAKPVGYRHFKWEHPDIDVGMCAAHVWLGLCCRGYEPEIEVSQDEDRALWRFAIREG